MVTIYSVNNIQIKQGLLKMPSLDGLGWGLNESVKFDNIKLEKHASTPRRLLIYKVFLQNIRFDVWNYL